MNADYPAELVNPEDEGIQERMRSLMLNSSFRGGESFSAREFVLSATRAPAVFIPVTFHVGLAAFRREFGRLPGTESELDHFAKIISPLLLKLAQFNISDLRIFNDKHFGNQRSRSVLPVAAYDNQVRLERISNGSYHFTFDDIGNYKESQELVEPTVGCPAVYAQANGQNVIRLMVTYCTDLLKLSGAYPKPN